MNYCVILLAAGLGTRLKPFTSKYPKCLAPIQGRPLLDYWLHSDLCLNAKRVFINTFYQATHVQKFLEMISHNNVVEISESSLKGTMGSLRDIVTEFKLNEDLLVVAHADNFLSKDGYLELFASLKAMDLAGGTVFHGFDVSDISGKGIFEIDENTGALSGFVERPAHSLSNNANAAIYFFPPAVITKLLRIYEPEKSEIVEYIPKLISTASYRHIKNGVIDIGTMPSLMASQILGFGRSLNQAEKLFFDQINRQFESLKAI
jgi:mannose-1-phosphate guanylyltransferase